MQNLFLVIVLIAAGVLLLSFYYTGRNIYRTNRETHLRVKILRKLYEDERNYIRNYLRPLLHKLKEGDLGWVQIASRIYPQDKIEILFNHAAGNIQMQNRCQPLNQKTLTVLQDLGLTAYSYQDEINFLSMPVNSKIVTDMLYYCLEEVYGQKKAKNIKIKMSGGMV